MKAAAASHTSAHVVTRNSHQAEITEFLRTQGLPNITVRVVPKKMSKGEFLKRTFFDQVQASGSNEQPAELAANDTIEPQLNSAAQVESSKVTCLFVDDDMLEEGWPKGSISVKALATVLASLGTEVYQIIH